MCWSGNEIEIRPHVAKGDITVYKFGNYSTEEAFFLPRYMDLRYEIGKLQKKVSIKVIRPYPLINVWTINEGYHSYSGGNRIRIGKNGIFLSPRNRGGYYSDIVAFERPVYIGRFIIPKGSTYYINRAGEVVSENIMYDGRVFVSCVNNGLLAKRISYYDVKAEKNKIK
jgi:hypothetical protein